MPPPIQAPQPEVKAKPLPPVPETRPETKTIEPPKPTVSEEEEESVICNPPFPLIVLPLRVADTSELCFLLAYCFHNGKA